MGRESRSFAGGTRKYHSSPERGLKGSTRVGGTEPRQRLAAILDADVAGYSRLMALDERETEAALDAARAMFRAQIAQNHGRVIDMAGDSVLALFETASGAVDAALAIQDALFALGSTVPEDRRMRFRIGLHLGDVTERPDGTVYGDGVNVAARLQAIAEPGGILVSEAVRGAVRGKVAAEFVDRGTPEMKNIAEPVRAFAIQARATHATAAGASPQLLQKIARRRTPILIAALVAVVAAAGVFMASSRKATTTAAQPPASAPVALALPTRPSIAVLPFENMGGDPEQAYFADGLTEDLITDLSKVSGLFVIARNSTFAYKGKATDVREVARTLGVRYVLEGSVRRSGNDVRVNAQLIDGATGGHLWATRQDGEWKRIFSLQDAMARSVVDALAVELTKDDRQRVARRETVNADAYDEFLKGWQLYLRQTPADFVAAIVHFKAAVELDPSYGHAYAALAAIHWEAYTRYWGRALGAPAYWSHQEPRVRAEQFLAQAMKNPTPLAHQVSSAILLHSHQYEEAAAEAMRGIESDPNDPDGYLAMAAVLSFTGKGGEALELVQRAMRLNPHYPPHYLYQLGLAQFGLGHLEEARSSLEKGIAGNPGDHWSERLLLASYGLLGQRAAATKLLEAMTSKDQRGAGVVFDPITVTALTYWYPFAVPSDAKRFVDGLRKAGVPE